MSTAVIAAALAGGGAVLAGWELIGWAQAASLPRRLAAVMAPLRETGGEAVTLAERRRLVLLLAVTLLGAGGLVGGLLPALAAGAAGPWLVGRALAMRRARWRRAMADGGAVAARASADALAGGHSVRGAIGEAAGAGGAGPAVDGELRRARSSMALGARTEAVLGSLRDRAGCATWDTLVAAILLQREAGGDLAALLRDLAADLEAVRRVQADARAATAQARFTAGTVAVLPVLAAVLAELAAPGTLAKIAAEPVALVLAAGAGVLQVAGVLVVRRLGRTGEL